MRKIFDDIPISEQAATQISNDIKKHRLSHAIILQGGSEQTRKLCAIQIAKAILCGGENPPCENCKSCKKVLHNSHPDLHFVQKEKDDSVIKVDAIRKMKKQTMLLPNDGDNSVFIVCEASNLNEAGFNAMLKLFEEPQPHVSIILTVDTSSNLIETILSRGTVYNISQSPVPPTFDERSQKIAKDILDSLCFKTEFDLIVKLLKINKDKDKTYLFSALDIVQFEASNALFLKNGVESSNQTDFSKNLCQKFSNEDLTKIIDNTKTIKEKLEANCNFKLVIAELSNGFYK